MQSGYWFIDSGGFSLAVIVSPTEAFVELEEDQHTAKRSIASFDADTILEAAAILVANSEYPNDAAVHYEWLEEEIASGEFWRNF